MNLNVPFAEKEQAKGLGAQWDCARKLWFLEDPEDLGPFVAWLRLTDEQKRRAVAVLADAEQRRHSRNAVRGLYDEPGDREVAAPRPRAPAKPRRDSKPGVATPRRDGSLPDCGCVHVPPWEHCEHSEPALEGAELAHIQSMNGGKHA